MRLLNRIEKHFGMRLPLAAMFEASTVAGLANLIRKDPAAKDSQPPGIDQPQASGIPARSALGEPVPGMASVVAVQPRGVNPPLYAVLAHGGDPSLYSEFSSLLGPKQPVLGVQVAHYDEPPVAARIEQHAASCLSALLAQQPEGPHLVIGASHGGCRQPASARDWLAKTGAVLGVDATRRLWSPRAPARANAAPAEGTERYEGQVTLFEADQQPPAASPRSADRGWSAVATSVSVLPVVGTHASMMRMPDVTGLATQVRAALAVARLTARVSDVR